MVIKKQGSEYCVFSEDGSRSFGCYDSEESAKNRLSQVEYFKRKEKRDPEDDVELKRCWEGYEAVPGKKPFQPGSCKKIGSKKEYEYGEVIEVKEADRPLNKPFRLPKGSSKKFGVFVRDGDSTKKVTFGDPSMEIRKDNEDARASFMARHKCDTATDKTTPRYWSCRMWKEDFFTDVQTKESRFTNGGIIEVKSTDDQLVVKGYIATTHPDAVKDVITKETLDKWANEINEGVPRANKVTYHHDRSDVRVVGVGVKGTARVDQLPDGEFGLYAETIVNKSHDSYDVIEYEYKIGALDSFSIEYLHTGEGKEGEGRVLDEKSTELYGWTLASRPVNEHAVMVKELLQTSHSQSLGSKEIGLENNTMSEQEQTREMSEAQLKELAELKEYKKQMEAQEKKKQEEKMMADKKKSEEEKMSAMKKEIVSEILESKEFNAKLDGQAEKPTMENKEQENVSVEYKEFVQATQDKELAPQAKLLASVNYALKEGLLENGTGKVESRLDKKGFDHVQANGTKLQVKSYGLGDNLAGSSSATALAAHRHADLVEALDAGIFNLLNDNVSAYDALPKTSATGSGSDHASFVVRSGRNPSAGAYTGTEISTGRTNKIKFSTKFKKYKAGFAVDGDLIAANRGAPQGSVLASEIEFATLDLKKEINTDLYTEQGLESSSKIIGMKYVADGEGNGTLYGETRTEANGLKYATADAANSYLDGSTGSLKDNIRTQIKNIQVDGGQRRTIRIFMHPTQLQRLKGEEDNALRYEPGASNVGFAANLTFEGVPIVEDVDCPEPSVFVVDSSSVELRFWVTPTVEMLGRRSDSEEGFVKTYLASIYKAPRRVTEIHSVPTA